MRRVFISMAGWTLIAGVTVGSLTVATAQVGSTSKTESIENRFAKAFESEDYAEMIASGLELSRLSPNDAHLQYLLALAYVSQGDNESAIKHLKKCAKDGYRNIGPSRKWEKFSALKSNPEFEKTLSVIRDNRTKGWEAFTTEAKSKEPLVIIPPNYSEDAVVPMLIVVHDRGGSPEGIAELFREPAKRLGALLVAPRSTHTAKDGEQSWGDTYGWRFRREAVFEAVFVVLNAAEHVAQKYSVDGEKIFVAGFSQGADVAIWATAFQGNIIRGVLAIGPRDYQLFERYRGSIRPQPNRFYLLVGEKDERLTDCLQLEDQILGANMPVKVKVLDGLGHEISKAQTDAITEGLEYLMDR